MISIGVQYLLGFDISLYFVFFGCLVAISPDLDFLLYYKMHKKVDHFAHKHRDILHYPLPYGFIGFAVFSFFDFKLGIIWLLGTLAHFIHDTLESGWGIKWFYPFWNKYINLKLDGPRVKIIMTKEEQDKIAAEYGNSEWLQGSISKKRFLIEVIIFLILLFLVFLIW